MTHRLLALLLLAIGCGSPLDPAERRELEAAERRWAARAPASYSFETRTSCFCPPELNVWSEVTVRQDTVVAVRALEPIPGGGPSPLSLHFWPTVPRLFDVVRSRNTGDFIENIRATYDPEFGYPRQIEVVCKTNVADCGATYQARNLKVLP